MQPLTINRPIPFGITRTGAYAEAEMRQKCVAIVGTPGSGKTVLEQCFMAGLHRCPDVLTWVIDKSNGGLANPWLNPWLDREMHRPVIDWLALDDAEALAMTAMALQVIDARRLAYRRLMRQHNTDKLPVSHDVPAIYLLLDEGKESTGATGNQRLIRNLIKIADKGRAVGVRLIITGLRGTTEVIPSEMMADIGTRITMQLADEKELGYILGWKVRYNPLDFPYPGCGLWRDQLSGAPRPFRSFDLHRPSSIERIALACELWRPALDEPSGAVPLGLHYGSRWERMLPVLRGSPEPFGTAPPRPAEPAQAAPGMSPGEPWSGRAQPSPAGGLDLEAGARAIARAKRAVHLESIGPDRVQSEFERLAEQLDDDRSAGGEGWRGAEAVGPRDRMRDLLVAAGPGGMSGPKLAEQLREEGYDVPTTTLYRWLKTDAADGGYARFLAPRFAAGGEG